MPLIMCSYTTVVEFNLPWLPQQQSVYSLYCDNMFDIATVVFSLSLHYIQIVSEQMSKLIQCVRATMEQPESASCQLSLINSSQAILAVSYKTSRFISIKVEV